MPAPPSLRPQPRFFSTSLALAKPPGSTATSIKALARDGGPAPTYPYPARTTYKQSNHGLYGGAHIQYGNNVSVKNALGKKRETKTRRLWRPNIQTHRLWSEALGRLVRVRLQARVLRTIDKLGGLDEYVLGNKARRIKELGVAGWELRWSIINTETVRDRFRREREELGVPESGLEARLQLREESCELDPWREAERSGDGGSGEEGSGALEQNLSH